MLTGTVARNGAEPGTKSVFSRYSRKAPVTMVSTTSFTVHSMASLAALIRSSGTVIQSIARCGPLRPLSGVGVRFAPAVSAKVSPMPLMR